MYKKIQSRVADQVYLKCSPIVAMHGRMSQMNKPKLSQTIQTDKNINLTRSVNFGNKTVNASLYGIRNSSKDELLTSMHQSTSQFDALLKQLYHEKEMRIKSKSLRKSMKNA